MGRGRRSVNRGWNWAGVILPDENNHSHVLRSKLICAGASSGAHMVGALHSSLGSDSPCKGLLYGIMPGEVGSDSSSILDFDIPL